MQKLIIGLLVICIGLFGGNLLLVSEQNSLNALHEAFEASEAQLLEITLNAWGNLSPRQSTEEQLKQVLRAGAQAAFNVVPTSFRTVVEDGFIMVHTEFSAGVWVVDATAQSLLLEAGVESYLIVTLISEVKDSGADLDAGRHRLQRFFSAAGSKPDLTACLVGSITGSLRPQEAAMIVGRVLAVLQAEMQESYSDPLVTTLSGYSNRLPGGISVAGRKSNISLTLRYNPEIGNTMLWFAWPTFTLSV